VGKTITQEEHWIINWWIHDCRSCENVERKGKGCPYKLYIVNSVQEEIGLRGAQMVAQNIKPNVAMLLMFVTKHPLLVILK
jgi:hypothetical protein